VRLIDDVIAPRLTLTPGARTLVATMRAHGAHTALVSGGFTLFTEPVALRLGFHETRANRLLVENGVLTSAIAQPILGAQAKAAALEEMRAARCLPQEATLAVGDGANDVEMVKAAGLGIAWRAKPLLKRVADACIDHAELTALLYAQGFRREEFVER
jgi:phosphoserine phosphatase